MRPLKLHTKTTLLTSAITIAVLATALALVNPRVADLVNEEQRGRAELQAVNLAEQISHMPAPRDPQMLAQAANLVRGARPNILAVRIWERAGGKYVETAAAANSDSAEEMPEETIAALRSGLASSVIKPRPEGANASLYRVFAPITQEAGPHGEPQRISGAVELVERLDDAPAIAVRFERTAIWMALVAVALITLVIYLLFRQLVYRPIERLLMAMARAEAGDLGAEAPLRAPDELGLLSRKFNRMIAQIRAMTEVRRLSDLERLAAARQTAAQFAHEVGTPLNLISGHVQLLRARPASDEKSGERIEIIGTQIERIERIVRSMLDRTQLETVPFAPLDLGALLLRTFDATAPALDAAGVRLIAEFDETLPQVHGDADRLQQVFINLINNALDAMPGGGELRVRLGVATAKKIDENGANRKSENAAGHKVFVEFKDTGSGIAQKSLARIFDPYFTTKGKEHGTGLGLVIARQVVREHGGEIEVESEPGRGASFRITLPAMKEKDQEAAVTSQIVSSV